MAAPKKLSAGQIINQLRRVEVALANGKRVKQVCRELGVSEQTYYRWREEYEGMKMPGAASWVTKNSGAAYVSSFPRFRRVSAVALHNQCR